MLSLSLRQTWHEWKAGPLAAIFWALTITLAALTAVNVTSDRAQRTLAVKAGELLAADLVVTGRERITQDIRQSAETLGLSTAETVSFPSVVFAGDNSLLVAAKAVTNGYPLRGQLEISDIAYAPGTTTDQLPATGEVWVESRLLTDLELSTGDLLAVGSNNYLISKVLSYEPDRAGGFAGLSPRLLLRVADAERAGLLRSQSRASWQLLVAGAPIIVDRFQEAIKAQPGIRITTPEQAQAQSNNALQQATQFLSLAALCAVLLGAAGMLQAGRRYALAQQQPVALLRCFGVSWSEILRLKLWQLLWLMLSACSLGVLLGLLAQQLLAQQLASILSNQLPGLAWQPIMETVAIGTLLLGTLCLPRLLQLRRQASLAILNEVAIATDQHWLITYLPAFVCLLAVSAWQLGNLRLAMIVLTGILILVASLLLVVKLVLWSIKHLHRISAPELRLALSGLQRHQQANTLHMTALGLALIALLVLGWVRNDMITQWQTSLAPDTPNRFLINIQPEQQQPLQQLLQTAGTEQLEFGPMAVARITHINGKPAADWRPDANPPGRRDGTVNLSWRNDLPTSNTITAGQWFDSSNEAVQISLSSNWAEALQLIPGHTLTFQSGEQQIQGTITSLRDVEWDSFNINFFILLNPEAAADLGFQWIASFYLSDSNTGLLREITRQYPNITIFDAQALIKQVGELLGKLIRALEIVFLFTLAAALVVLVNAVQSGLSERQRETAVLRCLGVKKSTLQRAWWLENILLGGLTGLLAVIVAAGCTWWISRDVLDVNWQLQPWLVAGGLLVGLVFLPLTTWLVSRRSLNMPPLAAIRNSI